jgi:hypothetical protein
MLVDIGEESGGRNGRFLGDGKSLKIGVRSQFMSHMQPVRESFYPDVGAE